MDWYVAPKAWIHTSHMFNSETLAKRLSPSFLLRLKVVLGSNRIEVGLPFHIFVDGNSFPMKRLTEQVVQYWVSVLLAVYGAGLLFGSR